MRRPLARSARAALLALLLGLLPAAAGAAPRLTVCFTPPAAGDCDPTALLLRAIAGARHAIHIQIYAFTARPVVAALVQAIRRGVRVQAIVDRSQLDQDPADARAVARLAAAGARVLIDTVPGLMHDKITIIDRATVLTGSFNDTWSAEHRNAENLLRIEDPALAAAYRANWDRAAARARPYGAAPPLAQRRPARRSRTRVAGPTAGPVRGSRWSHIYEWPGCPYYHRIAPRSRVVFASAAAAQAAGYRPARNCR